jgi:hypothetical protein
MVQRAYPFILESATYDNTARQDWPGLLLEGSPGRKGAGREDFFGGTTGKKPEGRHSPQAFHSAGLFLQLDET